LALKSLLTEALRAVEEELGCVALEDVECHLADNGEVYAKALFVRQRSSPNAISSCQRRSFSTPQCARAAARGAAGSATTGPIEIDLGGGKRVRLEANAAAALGRGLDALERRRRSGPIRRGRAAGDPAPP
jgi:hypothetical protein